MITPPWPSATLSPKQQGHVERSLRVQVTETPRKNKLYADTYKAWLRGNHATFAQLADLLAAMLFVKEELAPEDDEQLRMAYQIEARA